MILIGVVIPDPPSPVYDSDPWKDYFADYERFRELADVESETTVIKRNLIALIIVLSIFAVIIVTILVCCCPFLIAQSGLFSCIDVRAQARKFLALPPPGKYINDQGHLIDYQPTTEELFYFDKCKEELVAV